MVSPETLKDLALEAGFDLTGFTRPPTAEEREQFSLEVGDRKARGFRPGQAYPWMDSWDLPPETRTIVVLGFNYYQEAPEEPPGETRTVIARYLTGSCPALIRKLRSFYRSLSILGITPLNHIGPSELPLKWLAQRAGMGWIGKNSLLVTREFGSWVIWDAVLLAEELPAEVHPAQTGCADCDDCLRACPTSALYEPYKLDPTRCFTFFSETLAPMDAAWPIKNARLAFGCRVLGCDICQEICPHNRAVQTPGDIADLPLHIDLRRFLEIDDETYDREYRLTLWGIPRHRVADMASLMLGTRTP